MALVPKVVTSLVNDLIVLDDVRGYAGGEVRIPALASNLDLTTMATEDALAASFHLAHLANVGDITVVVAFNVNSTSPVGEGGPYTDVPSTNPALLAYSAITNVNASVITGDVDITPDNLSSVTPGAWVLHGTEHGADATARAAMTAATASYVAAQSLPGATDESGNDLSTITDPGIYSFSSSAALTGAMTLTGSSTDKVVFKIGSTLTTASASSVVLVGILPQNVLWVVGSSATLGTTTSFQGSIIAHDSITLNGGNTVLGSLSALTGAVALSGVASTVTAGGSNFVGVTWM